MRSKLTGSQHSKFDAQRSSTSQGPFGLVDVAYGQGETECEIIRDVARIASLNVPQQDMLLVTTNRLAGYEYAMYDGILGLGTGDQETGDTAGAGNNVMGFNELSMIMILIMIDFSNVPRFI